VHAPGRVEVTAPACGRHVPGPMARGSDELRLYGVLRNSRVRRDCFQDVGRVRLEPVVRYLPEFLAIPIAIKMTHLRS
jgi:hypothetical protein